MILCIAYDLSNDEAHTYGLRHQSCSVALKVSVFYCGIMIIFEQVSAYVPLLASLKN